MPFVNIHLPAHFTGKVKKEISLSVHESLVEIFNIPVDDHFQVIHPVAPEDLVFPDNYFGITHTANLVYIYITCKQGRTDEMKKALYAAIAKKIADRTDVLPGDVIIILNENSVANWSFGNGLAQMLN